MGLMDSKLKPCESYRFRVRSSTMKFRSLSLFAFLIILLSLAGTSAFALNPTLEVQPSTGIANGTANLSVHFSTGTSDVTGLVIDLVFPSSFTAISVTAGAAAAASGKLVASNTISPGVFRVLLIGFNTTALVSGEVFNVAVQIDNGTTPGNYFVNIGTAQYTNGAGWPVTTDTSGGMITVLTGGPISIFGVSVSGVTATDAVVNWMTDVAGDSQVEYGLTTAYGSTTVLDNTPLSTHSQSISGLAAATVYHYRVISGAATSGDYIFSTDAGGFPIFSAIASNVLGTSSATVSWNTDVPADSRVVYGTTTAYGLSTSTDPVLALGHSMDVTGLSANTVYHFAVLSRDAIGIRSISVDQTFTTAAPGIIVSSPVVSGLTVSNVTSRSADISWTTDQLSDSIVTYGKAGLFFLITPINTTLTTSHSVHLSNLTPDFTYDFWVLSRNTSFLIGASPSSTFTTSSASSTDYPTLIIGSGSGSLGGTVDIEIRYTPGIEPSAGVTLDLALPHLVSGASVATGSAAAAANMQVTGASQATGDYRVQIGGIGTTLSQPGTLATVHLTIDPSAFPGTYTLFTNRALFYDSNHLAVYPTVTQGTLVIGGEAPVRVWPNPWRSDLHRTDPVTFGNLTENSTVRIFTTSGYWVRTLHNTTNNVEWDLKNEDGSRVASGIYYYLVTSPQRPKVTGELVVIQ